MEILKTTENDLQRSGYNRGNNVGVLTVYRLNITMAAYLHKRCGLVLVAENEIYDVQELQHGIPNRAHELEARQIHGDQRARGPRRLGGHTRHLWPEQRVGRI